MGSPSTAPGARTNAPFTTSIRVLVAVAAAASLALTLFAGRHNPSVLLVTLFAVWVAGPYAGMFLGDRLALRSPSGIASAMRASMAVIAVGSVLIYILAAAFPLRQAAAFPFLAVPAVSWVALGLLLFSTRAARRRC